LRLKPRDRVMAAFEHREPDRVPLWCGASDEFWQKAKEQLQCNDEELRVRFGDDFRRVFASYKGPEFPLSPDAKDRSFFGVERAGIGYGQALNHPLAGASIEDIEDYLWPDPDWIDASGVRQQAEQHADTFAVLGGAWSPFWHDALELMGMQEMLVAMYEKPEVVDALLEKVVGFYTEVSRHIFEEAGDLIDIFFIGNDFGSQKGPLVGASLFDRFVVPHLRRLIKLGHGYDLKVMLHCCGGISPLIPSMIEAGLDGLHPIQPSCKGMELQAIKDQFGNKLLLNGAIDSHHVLIEGDTDHVQQKTREVLDIMMPGGGYIGGASHDAILEETPVENVLAMFDTIRGYGCYGGR